MQYIQILTCNDALGTCCTDYGLAVILDVVRKFFNILQLIAPILLIIGATIQLIKLMSDPDEKGSTKKILNLAFLNVTKPSWNKVEIASGSCIVGG